MSTPTALAFSAQLLERGASGYAGYAAADLLERNPAIRQSFGSDSLVGWKSHLTQRLLELAAALVAWEPQLFVAEARRALREWLPGVSLRAQAGGDLGERMADAFVRSFGRGARRVVIVGSDVPGVSRETALRALAALDAADLVLGPAEDGGYYLIALREPHPELVRGVDWGTSAVLAQTLERATSARLAVRLLEPLHDVDTLGDLPAVWPRLEPRLATRPDLRRACARALALPE